MKVRARIELFSSADGGREQPLHGSFRPNHRFDSAWFVVGQVEQSPDQALMPGECAIRDVNFIPEGLPALSPGMSWEICEGPKRVIGRGTVLEILEL